MRRSFGVIVVFFTCVRTTTTDCSIHLQALFPFYWVGYISISTSAAHLDRVAALNVPRCNAMNYRGKKNGDEAEGVPSFDCVR
jgi:hypothetical protein